MNLNKAKIFLDKINREFARMKADPENVTRIDVDIMKSYVRDFYESLHSEDVENQAVVHRQPEPARPVVQQKTHEFSPERPAPKPVTVRHDELPAPIPETSKPAPEPKPQPVAQAPVLPPEPVAVEIPKPDEQPQPAPQPVVVQQVVVEKPHVQHHHLPHKSSGEADLLFEQKQARELSEKLAERPIEDLKRGIALNDRLLFTRELFGNDNSFFDTALTTLNGFSGFEQAKNWLEENCVNRFDWLHKARLERAKEFIRLVRRRFK